MPDDLYTLDADGREVLAGPDGRPLITSVMEPEDAELNPVQDEVEVEVSNVVSSEFTPPDPQGEVPKDIDPECLVLETDTGWITFKPENILDEEHLLVLVLDGKANGFIPRLSAKFICHWKSLDGSPKTQNLYYAGIRFKLPQLPDKTILGFLKTR